MIMNEETLLELINTRFGDMVTITSFVKKDDRLPLLNDEDYSWRDYLLQTFSLRLKHAEKKDVDPENIKETHIFLEELRKLPEDAVLFIWQANSATNRYMGWASEEKLIYAHKI
jgi:hypothetical protein